MNFKPFPKIPRLSRDIIISEKLNGTNASVHIFDYKTYIHNTLTSTTATVPEWLKRYTIEVADGLYLACASRKRWLNPDNDNFGFARWVWDREDELKELGIGSHFGEWWGSGIQCTYGLKDKRLSLFNTEKWDGVELPSCVCVVPKLYHGPFTDKAVTDCIKQLEEGGSVAAPGFMDPEGIVIFHTASQHLYKKTIKNDGKPKGIS